MASLRGAVADPERPDGSTPFLALLQRRHGLGDGLATGDAAPGRQHSETGTGSPYDPGNASLAAGAHRLLVVGGDARRGDTAAASLGFDSAGRCGAGRLRRSAATQAAGARLARRFEVEAPVASFRGAVADPERPDGSTPFLAHSSTFPSLTPEFSRERAPPAHRLQFPVRLTDDRGATGRMVETPRRRLPRGGPGVPPPEPGVDEWGGHGGLGPGAPRHLPSMGRTRHRRPRGGSRQRSETELTASVRPPRPAGVPIDEAGTGHSGAGLGFAKSGPCCFPAQSSLRVASVLRRRPRGGSRQRSETELPASVRPPATPPRPRRWTRHRRRCARPPTLRDRHRQPLRPRQRLAHSGCAPPPLRRRGCTARGPRCRFTGVRFRWAVRSATFAPTCGRRGCRGSPGSAPRGGGAGGFASWSRGGSGTPRRQHAVPRPPPTPPRPRRWTRHRRRCAGPPTLRDRNWQPLRPRQRLARSGCAPPPRRGWRRTARGHRRRFTGVRFRWAVRSGTFAPIGSYPGCRSSSGSALRGGGAGGLVSWSRGGSGTPRRQHAVPRPLFYLSKPNAGIQP